MNGAEDRNRTGTPLAEAQDFKSCASTNFATPAHKIRMNPNRANTYLFWQRKIPHAKKIPHHIISSSTPQQPIREA